jgi:hypothetical protein
MLTKGSSAWMPLKSKVLCRWEATHMLITVPRICWTRILHVDYANFQERTDQSESQWYHERWECWINLICIDLWHASLAGCWNVGRIRRDREHDELCKPSFVSV